MELQVKVVTGKTYLLITRFYQSKMDRYLYTSFIDKQMSQYVSVSVGVDCRYSSKMKNLMIDLHLLL